MRLVSFLLFLGLLLNSCGPSDPIKALEKEISSMFEKGDGTFALAFKDMETGDSILINESESFHAASTMKTPVMIELFRQNRQGKFSLWDSLLVKDEFYSIVDSSIFKMDINVDSEGKLYSLVGQELPIYELMVEMITMSSNLATNILIDLVDARKVTESMREIGAENIQVLRGVEDLKAFEQGLSNSTTALDLMVIYENIASFNLVDSEACEDMINILNAQHFNDIIPKYLPQGTRVAHKTGSITGVHHDSGIVFLPDGKKYVIVLLSKELGDFDAGTEMLAQVSKLIFEKYYQ